jgi:hypothetical protein
VLCWEASIRAALRDNSPVDAVVPVEQEGDVVLVNLLGTRVCEEQGVTLDLIPAGINQQ